MRMPPPFLMALSFPALASAPGISVQAAGPTIRNCTFNANSATAIFISQTSSPQIQNCVFQNGALVPVDIRSGSLGYALRLQLRHQHHRQFQRHQQRRLSL